MSNDATYQSCFCQSALLTPLDQGPGAQLCTQCSPQDMQAIQTWYQSFCRAGASALQSGGASSRSASTSTVAQATSSIRQVQNNPTQTAAATAQGAGSNSAGVTNADASDNRPWYVSSLSSIKDSHPTSDLLICAMHRFSTHWKWIVMLVVVIIGLTAFAVIFTIFHRRYHRRREQQWSQSTVPHPDINTWGPGQSVHDFGGWSANLKRSLSRSLSRNKGNGASSAEKGKATGRGRDPYAPPPVPPKMTETRGTGFGARQPTQNGRIR